MGTARVKLCDFQIKNDKVFSEVPRQFLHRNPCLLMVMPCDATGHYLTAL